MTDKKKQRPFSIDRDKRSYQKYVRRSQVETIRHKCEQHRQLQIKLRAGRAEYKQLLARARELFWRLS